MRKFIYALYLLLGFLANEVNAQDFSNRGTDFWVAYGYHQVMTLGNQQQMVLYFATDAVTTVTVEIPGLGYSQTYPNIPANTIFTSNPLPKVAGPQDARLLTEGVSNKGIHIKSDKPIVAYTHIYNESVSGATLLFPTPTLGKEYYSINYDQVSNTPNANSWVYAIAVDTGTTTLEVIPSENTLSRAANVPFTVNLQQGQVLNLMGALTNSNTAPHRGVDLTGTRIRSISSGGSGCKRIAVFSGSGRISLTCNGGATSSDNYIVQAFPKNAWGKKFLTVPTRTLPNNFFRICVSDPSTVVKFNGTPLTAIVKNFYYQINTNQPGVIEADKPIMVSQVITSQGECSNGSPGDPEIIYLSPVEQNIEKVILNSTSNYAITQHWINVVIKASAVASFKIDGASAQANFVAHPRDPNYMYAQLSVGAGQHTLTADSGFNAIAYGFGNFESYGYNAGTNVKDLYQFVSIHNQFATVNYPSTCRNTPFFFSMTFPYQPTEIKWQFGSVLNGMGISDVVLSNPVFDSTWVVNDKQLYRYKLTMPYAIPTVGTYPIKVIAQNPTPDGCSGEQEINYNVQVVERPKAEFNFTTSGCVSDSVRFADNSNAYGQPIVKWNWDFGDGRGSSLQNPAHLYTAPNTYNAKFSVITDMGCVSDTIPKPVTILEPPTAKFGITTPYCVGRTISFSDSSYSNSSIVKWTWDFGDGSTPIIANTNATQTHTYAAAGNYTVSLRVENSSGCKSIAFTRDIIVTPNPVVDFTFGKACLPNGAVQFTDKTTISDGSEGSFAYNWTFGDGGNAQIKNPTHNYSAVGPFNVSLQVTSNAGCVSSVQKVMDSVFAQPTALFSAPAEVCFGTTVNFTDQSSVQNSTISGWLWDFGDGSPQSNLQNPTHNYASAGTYTVTLISISSFGCTSAPKTGTVVVNSLPTADFTVSTPACETKSLTFNDASTPNSGNLVKWAWNFGDGSATVSQQSPIHIYNVANTYTVSLQVETDKGCVSTVTSKPITISPQPKPGFIMPGNCINDPVTQFVDTSSIADGSEALFTYQWNFGDPNANTSNPNSSTAKNPTHRYTATGDYNVTLTVTSNNGCSATVPQKFTINGAVPVPIFSIANGVQHCSNDSIIITDNSTVNPGRLVRLEIYWDYDNDPTNKSEINLPVAGAAYGHKYPEFFTPATKNYHVKLVAYSGINCLTEKDTIITLMARPEIVFPPIASVCANANAFQIQADVTNMTGGNGVFSGTGVTPNGLFTPTTPGKYTITYTYTGVNGCVNSKEQTVTVFAVPSVNAGSDKFVLEGGTVALMATASGNGLSYLWSPATYLNNATIAQPTSIPKDDIRYTLTVTSADGCTASDDVLITLLKAPVIPNVFSPNGDGIHDRWDIKYLESYPGATVEIYNRYGQKVFESRGYGKPWDGTYKGSQVPAGTYYYIINPKNGRQPMAGYVDVIR